MPTDFQSAPLTERRIRDARPGKKTIILRDREVVGLAVRIAPGGTKSYVLDYRAAGRRHLATLARCSEIALRDARTMAGRELVAIRTGGADPLRRRQEAREAPTVNAGLDRFFNEFVPRRIAEGRMAERTRYDYGKQADRTIRPALGTMKIAEVTRAEFERWEWRAQGTNPARLIEKAREWPRDRVLAPSEIGALGAALDTIANPFTAAALRFLMLTGWRNGEALAMRWQDLNFETGEIVLMSTKTGRDRRTISEAALEIVAGLPRINGNPHVFAGARSAALSYKTLHTAFARACATAGIEDARLHDVRRTLATTAAASGLTLIGLRDLLNHKTTTMAARYARRSDSVLRTTQNEMADKMAALMRGDEGDVVPLDRRRG